jgi:triacylglycerol lipase
MKKTALVIFLVLILATTALAGGSKPKCATKYPVVLAHGMAANGEILGIIDYWWGIEGAIEKEGGNVFVANINAMDSTEKKAQAFKAQYLQILAVTKAAKANIIGHSHGAIYSRYAISNLGLASTVASWTSICGPHRGSPLADIIMFNLPNSILTVGGGVIDFLYALIMGDDDPDVVANGWDLVTEYMMYTFNPNTPDIPGIYYQSWATKVKLSAPSLAMEIPWLVMLLLEGDNDGLVSVASAKWGNFRGVESGAWYSPGVDHINAVGHLFGLTPGFDAPGFYVGIVEDLVKRGY